MRACFGSNILFTVVILFISSFQISAVCAESHYICPIPPDTTIVKDQFGCVVNRYSELKYVDGIPFLSSSFWNPGEGDSIVINVGDIEASKLYIHGGLNSVDLCHPAWGGGKGFENFFIGSQTGEIRITYSSGQVDIIPLIVGYTSWINYNYKISPEPFKSDTNMSKMLDNALCVSNGLRGYENDPDSYYLVINLRNEKVDAIELHDNAVKIGYFKVDGLSFEGVSNKGSLPDSAFSEIAGQVISDAVKSWVAKHTIESSDGYPSSREDAIEKLRLKFCTQASDINFETISKTKPDITPSNFECPKVKFSGSPSAELMTNIYYENSHEILSRVDDDGTVHESSKGADNFNALGGWTEGLGPFYTNSYTRIRALTLLSNIGFSKKVNAAIDYYDKWMMYFPKSYPSIQLGGKPVPGHATVIANEPLIYFDVLSKHGWPTKYKVRDFGNGENDGHGMLMISRWRAWLKQGKTKEWVDKRWDVIKEAAEYIPWCLENPKLSFSEHGLLYSESEGGMQIESMFCDFNCYIGLLGYIDMAKSTGRKEWAQRWQKIADKYLQSMNVYYPTTISPWGDVWDPDKTANWGNYFHATLAPAVIGMDYWGYDVMNKLPSGWAERTLRTYKMQLTRNSPAGAATAGIGYGQGYITEAALLTDNMKDASLTTDWMAKICFAPRLQHPYRVPEGSVVESDGSIWRRWGDLGNLYQLAEVVYTIQLIIGIDDIQAKQLVLMPRMPLGWKKVEVSEWPIRALSEGSSQMFNLSMSIGKNGNEYTVALQSDKAVDKGKIRIGPFNISVSSVNVTRNGEQITCKLFVSGDSKWVWVDFGNGQSKSYKINVKAQWY